MFAQMQNVFHPLVCSMMDSYIHKWQYLDFYKFATLSQQFMNPKTFLKVAVKSVLHFFADFLNSRLDQIVIGLFQIWIYFNCLISHLSVCQHVRAFVKQISVIWMELWEHSEKWSVTSRAHWTEANIIRRCRGGKVGNNQRWDWCCCSYVCL